MHLAELNIGRLIAPTDDPRVAEFMDNLDRINGLGKRMPGFVWMMEGSGEPGTGNTDACIDGDPLFVANLSVWETPQQLETFVFGTLHEKFMRRGKEWFESLVEMDFVMWWVPEGTQPSLDDALAKLAHRQQHGDSPEAFGWNWMRAQAAQ
jgi:hypothetical protein